MRTLYALRHVSLSRMVGRASSVRIKNYISPLLHPRAAASSFTTTRTNASSRSQATTTRIVTETFSVPDPRIVPVRILVAEQESIEAAHLFAEQETNAQRPTFVHTATTADAPDTDRPGLHLVYKPDLTPQNIVEHTRSGRYFGIRVRAKTVPADAVSLFDLRIGTGIDNFQERMKAKQGQAYILENCPGQNTVATAEWTQMALSHALAPALFNRATEDILSQTWLSPDLANSQNPHKSQAGELAGKSVAVLGMGNIGMEVARRCKAMYMNVVGWGYTRADGTESFSAQDAKDLGIAHASSVEEAVANVHAVCVHTPGSAKPVICEQSLRAMQNPHVVICNAARATAVDKIALAVEMAKRRRHAMSKGVPAASIRLYEDSDAFRATGANGEDARKIADAMKSAISAVTPESLSPSWEQRLSESVVGKLAGPCVAAIVLHCYFPEWVRVSPHWGGDRTPESDFGGAMQGHAQTRALLYDHTVFNACTHIPETLQNMGSWIPAHVGRVSADAINSCLANEVARNGIGDALAELTRILQLRDESSKLDHETAALFHTKMNELTAQYTTNDVLQASLLGRSFDRK